MIRSFDSISGGFLSTYFNALKHIWRSKQCYIALSIQYLPLTFRQSKHCRPRPDCSRSALFASTFIKHSLIPQKGLFKFEDGKVHWFTKMVVVLEHLGKIVNSSMCELTLKMVFCSVLYLYLCCCFEWTECMLMAI